MNEKTNENKVAPGAKGLENLLASAQGETRRNLEAAIEKKNATGLGLMDILRQDMDRQMFGKVWRFLNQPIGGGASVAPGPDEETKKVKDVLVEQGLVSSEDLGNHSDEAEAYDHEIARILLDRGQISEEQLTDALGEHQRSGQSVWRILINRGAVSPQQIADARRQGVAHVLRTTDEAALTQVILNTGLVTAGQCEAALAESRQSGRHVFQLLIDRSIVNKNEFGHALAGELDIPYVDLEKTQPRLDAVKLLPDRLAKQYRMIPLSASKDRVKIAMVRPEDVAARELFRMLAKKDVEVELAFEADVTEAIRQAYAAIEAEKKEAEEAEVAPTPLERLKARLRQPEGQDAGFATMVENIGVVSLVSSVIEGAIGARATDIHLEPQSYGLRVRYRVDGMLYDIMNLPEQHQEEVIARVKVLAGMDITERRHPQDGHFQINVQKKSYDLRIATLPTIMGEKVVIRLLSTDDIFMGLRELGLEGDQLTRLQESISQPNGMILVTGPTGSGKTTTLYAALSEIDIFTRNVVTIEDPVEYRLPGINQVEVDARVHRSFANMLRSAVRQDVDVMMVGEIRDEDTAHVAVRAAMTGHMVLSTLHTNDAVGAINALVHYGIKPYVIVNSVIAVVAQRLVRRVCPSCRQEFDPAESQLKAVGLSKDDAAEIAFYKTAGCDECGGTGYRGRTGLFEVFRLTDTINNMLLNGKPHDTLAKQARQEGMQTLMQSGLSKVASGATTLDELLRVTTVS